MRIFNTYGPRMRANDGRAIPAFMSQALADRPVTVFGDGSQTRSFCFVDDLVRGLVALQESGVHEPVNIGNPSEMTLLEMAEAIVEVTESRSEIVFEALPIDDPKVRQPDIARARDLLGWEPEIELRDGLRAHGRALHEHPRRALRAMSAEAKNLEAIVKAIEQHDRNCEYPALAVAMNPFEVERLGWDTIKGLPIRAGPQPRHRRASASSAAATRTARGSRKRKSSRRSPSRRRPTWCRSSASGAARARAAPPTAPAAPRSRRPPSAGPPRG